MGSPWVEHEQIVVTVRSLCETVRDVVRPHLGRASAKGHEGSGASGDMTFSIDEVAERAVEGVLGRLDNVAYYSEDRGLVLPAAPEYLLIIDPIDGTRPAAAGLESCCVSVAAARYDGGSTDGLTLADVFLGVVGEIKNDAFFSAIAGGGARLETGGRLVQPSLSEGTELSRIFWTAGYRGRPAEPLTAVMSELIDLTSVDGGYFDLGSAAFNITRVVTGQMDAYVDVGQRMVEESEGMSDLFLQVGHGAILNNFAYDIAAAALVASEAGAAVSDAGGEPLDRYPLVPREGGGQVSTLVASNESLHGQILEYLDRGMERLGA
ncbi:MAG: hypothetical protein KKF41_07180 [Actinobacteria bacterium]|nr:hypothetical protein [Actinomycetota bacterium]MBU1942090.1 hypothetical protein [Actinomycetota bacterium]MBU2687351.1 hypothetical protein [Actinomycetota bacterium]